MEEKKWVEVAIAVIVMDGQLLIAQRPMGVHLGGLWEFPGGKIDAGETPEAALIREAREELGVELATTEKLPLMEHHYPQRSVRIHPWRCRVIGGEPRAIGCQQFRWVRAHQLVEFEFPVANRQLIEGLIDRLGPGPTDSPPPSGGS